MTTPEPSTPEPSTPEPSTPGPRPPAGLPPAPWILIDRTTVDQTRHLLGLLEQWLAGADSDATEDCARSCSAGEADAFAVAAWAGTLAAHLQRRIDTADGPPDWPIIEPGRVDPWP
jgi:hypothetical protein